MVERGRRLGLVNQPLARPIVAVPPLGQHLDGNFSPEFAVLREKDLSHAARAELTNDSVVADL